MQNDENISAVELSKWQDFGNQNSVVTNLFDNFFGWVNDSLNSRYKTIDELRAESTDKITAMDDGYQLDADRISAIEQRSSRGFTIIDINPGLLTEQRFPLSIPYEFLFDGTNFMPTIDGSLSKNFRTVPIEIAGNFVKIEYIYENNSQANLNTSNARPSAAIKYQSALKNTSVVNGQTIYSETDLSTGYTSYDFDNYARNKVFLAFGDNTQKPHLIRRSGDYFKTYFNTLNLSLNIGAPKIRITVGFNSEKYDGTSDAPINSSLELMGGARLFKDIDTPLVPYNIQFADLLGPGSYDPTGLGFLATPVASSSSLALVQNSGYNTIGGPVSLGYSVLWITGFSFTVNRTIAANVYVQMNLSVGGVVAPSGGSTVRIYGAKLDLISSDSAISKEHTAVLAKPIRVVIPNGSYLFFTYYYQSNVNVNILLSFSLTGYSLGSILKVTGLLQSTKFITDSTFLTDYNRVTAIRD